MWILLKPYEDFVNKFLSLTLSCNAAIWGCQRRQGHPLEILFIWLTRMLSSVAALTSGYTAPTALPQSRVAVSMSMDIGGLKDMAKSQNPVVVSGAEQR